MWVIFQSQRQKTLFTGSNIFLIRKTSCIRTRWSIWAENISNYLRKKIFFEITFLGFCLQRLKIMAFGVQLLRKINFFTYGLTQLLLLLLQYFVIATYTYYILYYIETFIAFHKFFHIALHNFKCFFHK